MSIRQPLHRYYICLKHHGSPVPWNPHEAIAERREPVTIHDMYFGRVFCAFESLLQAESLTVYLTWDLSTLPSYGDNVIAVVLGDEWCRVPAYAGDVLAVFKCYGSRSRLPRSALLPTSYLRTLVALQHVRTHIHRLPDVARSVWRKMSSVLTRDSKDFKVYPIPLGYANQIELPVVPIEKRTVDIFFAGSLSHNQHSRWSPLHWLCSPKHVAREQAVKQAAALQSLVPGIDVDLRLSSEFAPHAVMFGKEEADILDADQCSAKMMNSRICLAPRGTSPETFRYFEGLRAGCIVVTDVLPKHWYYDGSPAIEIHDWSKLPSVVLPLLRDYDAMNKLHRMSLNWWTERCSELALARYMAGVISRKRPGLTTYNFSPMPDLVTSPPCTSP